MRISVRHEAWERNDMALVAGVDGCKGGWVAVLIEHSGLVPDSARVETFVRFEDLLRLDPLPEVIAIDIPIGLLDRKGLSVRSCDMEARKLLGKKASSIFPAPLRCNLDMKCFEIGRGISQQTFHIQPKVREVDETMNSDLQRCVYEAHPELILSVMAGRTMTESKKRVAGRKERLDVLRSVFASVNADVESACTPRRKSNGMMVKPDDVIDAFAAGWTAMRINIGVGQHTGNDQRDSRGLLMKIWY